jgi:Ca2+-binding RTX toxin-like protein
VLACGFPQPSHAAPPAADRKQTPRGTAGPDVLRGTARVDVLDGRGGDDRLLGRGGPDRLFGGRGHDTLHGQAGADQLSGGPGRDGLFGGNGTDTLRGGPGNDILDGGDGKDRIVCGPGLDVVLSAAENRLATDCEQKRTTSDGDDDAWAWRDLWDAAWLVVLVLGVLVATAGLVRMLLGPSPPWAGKPEERPAAPAAWLPYTLPVPILGVLGIGIYTLTVADVSAFAAAVLVAVGVYLVGGLFGFLFGIPKSLTGDAGTAATGGAAGAAADSPEGARFKPNTNLEEISDWLTKIIVGLTLVQFRQLIDQIHQLSEFFAPALGNAASTPSFVIGIFMVFSISGFLTLYAATRLYGGEFSRAEGRVGKALNVLRDPKVDAKLESYSATAAPASDEA